MDDVRRVVVITVTQGIAKPYVVRHNNREEIFPLLRQSSGSAPEFEATEDHLRLTMWQGTERVPSAA